eukprot:TRINITY_DN34943_c0_g1_i1.p1 TRINITY_DN34943_c0_g1~~TRINITY_DN34943_c0_g1_i1.p1  ORF type:complete len:376 (+),score=167.63 TRINITY_DN34943_c0_g1_i1:43-1128(+)
MGFLSGLAKRGGDALLKNLNPQKQEEMALDGQSPEDYSERTKAACPADVYMFSGCMDKQTSADVSNVQSFGLPAGSGPGGAGGACTNALLAQAYKPGEATWMQVLNEMVSFLQKKGYSQVPMLSTSRQVDLNAPFSIPANQPGRKIALLIGINYTSHSQGRLNGCVNDVCSMKGYLTSQGFPEQPDAMRILTDAPHQDIRLPTVHPSKQNILDSFRWVASQARPGDTIFFHYSGHGGQQRDTSGDEEDGMDETLIPEDYKSAGVITDDDLFKELVAPLPSGVRLVCVMDCCHSGTILDLPYVFVANSASMQAAQSASGGGQPFYTHPNPAFNAVIQKLLALGIDHLSKKYPQLAGLTKFMK